MKVVTIAMFVMLLTGCSATIVSYQAGDKTTYCPPVVNVQSLGSSVSVYDGSECKVTMK